MDFNRYLQAVSDSIQSQNGPRLQELISLQCAPAQQAIMASRSQNPRWNPAPVCRQRLGAFEAWSEFMACHCACLAALQEGNRVEAYTQAVNGLQPFIKAFREDEGSWVVFPMHSVVHNLRSAAEAADTELRQSSKSPSKLVDCGDQLRKCFSVSLQAPGNKDKKLAALDIVNVSIKIYFKLSTLRLCKNLIRTVESRQFAAFESFPAAQRVTYKFYMGRLAVFDENYQAAEEALSYALKHCHRSSQTNKARILKYLVPVQLLLGRLPTAALLTRYNLHQYQPIVAALKSGDVASFDTTMAQQQVAFIQQGTYLLLEKLRQAVYRRLLRRVWLIHAAAEPAKAAQIPLSWFQTAVVALGVDMDMDEVECVCANLIYRKYVKGYISHKSKVMVVAKSDPFPPLSGVMLTDG